jgi:ketosteroid isomerase-like protein
MIDQKQLSTFLQAVFVNDLATIAPMLADDIAWHTPQSALPTHRGIRQGKDAILALLAGGPKSPHVPGSKNPDVQFLLVADNAAVAQYRQRSRLKSGGAYENQYCLFLQLRDGLIVEAWEHLDSENFYAQFGIEPDWLQSAGEEPVAGEPPVPAQLSHAANATLAVDFITALYARDAGVQASLLADDAVWHALYSARPGYQGTLGRDAILRMISGGEDQPWLPGTTTPRFEISFADGDMAAVQLRLKARTRNRRFYDSQHVFVLRCRGGRVAEIWEHLDTALLYATAGIAPTWLRKS